MEVFDGQMRFSGPEKFQISELTKKTAKAVWGEVRYSQFAMMGSQPHQI